MAKSSVGTRVPFHHHIISQGRIIRAFIARSSTVVQSNLNAFHLYKHNTSTPSSVSKYALPADAIPENKEPTLL